MLKLLIAAALLASASAATAAAPSCNGQFVGMRVSKLKPGGSMAGFAEAAKANQAWYAAKGFKDDKITVAPVYESTGGVDKPSVTKVATFHVYGTTPGWKRDAAWTAFVAKYNEQSSIESDVKLCLPKGTFR
jgi:hypothetical protein